MPASTKTKNTTVKKSATKKTPAKAPKTSVKKTNSAATTPSYKPGGLFSKKTKEDVLHRQKCVCPSCGAHLDYTNDGGSNLGGEWNAHHIVPREQNGDNDPKNCAVLCRVCHKRIHKIQKAFPNENLKQALQRLDEIVEIKNRYSLVINTERNFDNTLQDYKAHSSGKIPRGVYLSPDPKRMF